MRAVGGIRMSKLAGTVVAVALSLAAMIGGTGVADAQQPRENCQTFNKRYFLGSGSAITLRVAFVDASLQICRGQTGFITRASASQTVGVTGPGTAAGFNIDTGPATVVYQDGIRANAEYSGRIRICIAQRTPICSQSSDYKILGAFSPVGPQLGDLNAPKWSTAGQTPGGVAYYENA